MCDPLCQGCIYSIMTPLEFMDCKKCKSMLVEHPNRPGWYYFVSKQEERRTTRYSEEIMNELADLMNRFLETHKIYELLELVEASVATKEQN